MKSGEWMDRYRLKFLGSVQVPFHKGNDVLCAAMQKVPFCVYLNTESSRKLTRLRWPYINSSI